MGLISLNTPCLFLGCLLLSTFGEDALANKTSVWARCPPESLPFRGNCFQIFDDALSWEDAYTVCSALRGGSFLATITDVQELNVLASFIRDSLDLTKAWIGLSKVQNQPWRWADGSRYKYNAWSHYADNEDERFSCAVLDVNGYFGQPAWVLKPCDNDYPFVCKFLP